MFLAIHITFSYSGEEGPCPCPFPCSCSGVGGSSSSSVSAAGCDRVLGKAGRRPPSAGSQRGMIATTTTTTTTTHGNLIMVRCQNSFLTNNCVEVRLFAAVVEMVDDDAREFKQ